MEQMPKILVVDDEPGVCKSCSTILTRKGYDVDTVLNANDALNLLKTNEYSVVITDMVMPKMNGLDLLKTIREELPHLNVIIITGYATTDTAVSAMKLGAFDYIPKPFTPDELRNVTERAVEKRKEFKLRRIGDRYYTTDNAWAEIVTDGSIRVGVDYALLRKVGIIANIDLPYVGDRVSQGKVCATLTSADTNQTYKFNIPVSGEILEVNQELNRDASLAQTNPLEKGWFVRIRPARLAEDLKNTLVFRKMTSDLSKVDQVIDGYEARENALIQILLGVQKKCNWLSQESIERVNQRVGVPISRIYQMATFYKAFSLVPKGKYVASVCMGTACHVRGATLILDKSETALGIKAGETTKDLKFSLETVNCIGCCALGPVIKINDKHHGHLSPSDVERIFMSKK